MQKRAIAIHDISCVGRCSLTVALPILSAAGIETSILPTALLSTHTGEFVDYTHFDLSDQLSPIANHLKSLDLTWNAIYTGYLASPTQVAQVENIIKNLKQKNTLIFVDPAFGDHGKMYSLLPEDMPMHMLHLVKQAQTIVPNVTEACLLLNTEYIQTPTKEDIELLCKKLHAQGPLQVIITGIFLKGEEDKTSIAISEKNGDITWIQAPRQNGVFHGTGDVYASFLLSALLNGLSLHDSASLALSLVQESIAYTLKEKRPLRYGVAFETALPNLIYALNNFTNEL